MSEEAALSLQVNGEPRACPAGLSLEQALEAWATAPDWWWWS